MIQQCVDRDPESVGESEQGVQGQTAMPGLHLGDRARRHPGETCHLGLGEAALDTLSSQPLGETAQRPGLDQGDLPVDAAEVEDPSLDSGPTLSLQHAEPAAGDVEDDLGDSLHRVQDGSGSARSGPPVGEGPEIEEPGTGAGEEGERALRPETAHDGVEIPDHDPGPRLGGATDDLLLEGRRVRQPSPGTGVDDLDPLRGDRLGIGDDHQHPGRRPAPQEDRLQLVLETGIVTDPDQVVPRHQPVEDTIEIGCSGGDNRGHS